MNLKKLFLFLLLLLFYCQKQPNENPLLATVGNRHITVSEFKDRVNFNPITGNKTESQYKNRVLNSIIAERLLSQAESFDQPEIVSLLAYQKHREAVIEQLWDEVIFYDIEISDSTLWQFYLKTNKQRSIEFAVFDDSVNAKIFQTEWKKDNPAAKQVVQIDTISFNGNLALLEKEVFSLPIGQISNPVKMGRKYLVYKPGREWQNKVLSRQVFYKERKSVKKQYLKYEKQKRFLTYSKKTFKKASYKLDKTLFKELTKNLEARVVGNQELSGKNLELFGLAKMAGEMNPSAKMVNFISGEEWTIEKFFKRLVVSPYPLNFSTKDAFRYSMIRAAKRVLDDELLFQKGLEYKLEKSSYVGWQTEMWRDFYYAQTIAKRLKQTKKFSTTLDSLKDKIPITINRAVLDSLTLTTTKMMVLKTHFPGQTIVPGNSDWGFAPEKK